MEVSLYPSVFGFIPSTNNSTLKPYAYIECKLHVNSVFISIQSMYLNMYYFYLEQKTERVSETRVCQTFIV